MDVEGACNISYERAYADVDIIPPESRLYGTFKSMKCTRWKDATGPLASMTQPG